MTNDGAGAGLARQVREAKRNRSPRLEYHSGRSGEEIPDEIGELTWLEELIIRDVAAPALPDAVCNLTNLRVLDLGGNVFDRLPDQLGNLTKLRQLDLFLNRSISALPESMAEMRELEFINLGYLALTELPDWIGRLSSLATIRMQNNQLTSLPAALKDLDKLEYLDLRGNEGLSIPPEIIDERRRPQDILNYYFDSQVAAAPLNEVKLLLVGRGGSGKSSVRDRLLHDTFDPDKGETPGIEIEDWPIEVGGNTVQAHVWDFAGQEITHATHRFFLTERSIYLLVLDARSDTQDQDAEYWLRLIAAFGSDSPVIVALNKWDLKPFDVDRNVLREKYPSVRRFIPTDCDTRRGIEELDAAIREAVDDIPAVREMFPASWITLKNHFSSTSELVNYQSLDAFRQECAKQGEDDPDRQERLARTLHALGVILHYADDPRLRDTTVLNPHWVTQSIYTLLRLKEGPRSDGILTLRDARAALPDEKPVMVRYLIDLMRRFELCFPADEKGEKWLIPELLPRFQPELGDEWRSEEAVRVRYGYAMLPEGLIPRLITRTYPLSDDQLRWRNGVVLEMEGTRALVSADASARQVKVTIVGEPAGRLRLAKLLRGELNDIHRDLPGIEAREEVEVAGHPGTYKSVQTLVLDERFSRQTTIDTERGSEPVDQKGQLDRISAPAARDDTQQRLKVFVSYSHEDASLHDVFKLNLRLLEADGLIEWWFDGKILPSAEWDVEIRHELASADIILFLVSTPFLSSKYIRGVEMKAALERRQAGEAELVAVILEKCRWKNRQFTKYQAILPGGKPVRNWGRYRDAFNEVELKLSDLIAEMLASR